MERRTVFLIVGLLVALALLGGAFCVWAFGPDELERKAEQVQPGMTKSEVEAILGKADVTRVYSGHPPPTWVSDRVFVTVLYDRRNGKVVAKEFERRPLWDRIRKKLPW